MEPASSGSWLPAGTGQAAASATCSGARGTGLDLTRCTWLPWLVPARPAVLLQLLALALRKAARRHDVDIPTMLPRRARRFPGWASWWSRSPCQPDRCSAPPGTSCTAKVPGTAGGGRKQGMPSHQWWQRGCGHTRAWGGTPSITPRQRPSCCAKEISCLPKAMSAMHRESSFPSRGQQMAPLPALTGKEPSVVTANYSPLSTAKIPYLFGRHQLTPSPQRAANAGGSWPRHPRADGAPLPFHPPGVSRGWLCWAVSRNSVTQKGDSEE